MKFEVADCTVGDVGVTISVTVDETITGEDIDFKLCKPSGSTIIRSATTVSGYTASYNTVSGDFDEPGEWKGFAYNATHGYHYTKESGHIFYVRPKPEDMAVG